MNLSKLINVCRTDIRLYPDQTRVVLRPLRLSSNADYLQIIHRTLILKERDVQLVVDRFLQDFSSRHRHLTERLLTRFHQIEQFLSPNSEISEARKILIASYFVFEYSAESSALFNPSIVAHPDQSGLQNGELRFLMSLRSTGEGHISSIGFRSGVIHPQHQVTVDPPSRFLSEPELIENPTLNKPLFFRKLFEMGLNNSWTQSVMNCLGDSFTLQELRLSLQSNLEQTSPGKTFDEDSTASGIWLLAKSNYEIQFALDQELSERIIFPITSAQSNGVEDVRLVPYQDETGKIIYYATYTAYDGRNVLPQLFQTEDFHRFKFSTLNGPRVKNKGMALFPRKMKGQFAMLSRQDGENIFLMYSDNVHFWSDAQLLLSPSYPWEFLKIGNCGSPIETDKGWLVLSHGVGPMRQYCLGAFLLDLEDPSKVIGRLSEPLMIPKESEREGYVPNVLYTCGSILHNNQLILPYGISDRVTGFATIPITELLSAF